MGLVLRKGTVSIIPPDHSTLANLQLSANGVTYGHVDDQAQTIYGEKTFNDNLDILGNLEINGITRIFIPDQTDFTGTIYIGANTAGGSLSHTGGLEGQYNTYVGELSGNANTTGAYNNGFGAYSLYNNTTGDGNFAAGYASMLDNTTGNSCTGIGQFALQRNDGADNNTGAGYAVLAYNVIGENNSGFGANALYDCLSSNNSGFGAQSLAELTSGGNNTGGGYQSGRFIAGGVTENRTSTNSVYLGMNTKASADGNTNEIVIGYDATGNGSNTVTLGDTNIIDTYIRGDLHLADIKSGDTQVAAGAAADELWKTSGHATLPDNVVMIGV